MRSRTQRFFGVVAILAVALALPVVNAAPSLAATRLSLSPTNPVAREYIKLGGRFGTSFQRPVRLEYWNGTRWALVDSKSTTSTGRFSFRTRAVKPARKFRAHAPRVMRNGRTYSAVKSDPRTVRTVTPTARLALVPAKIGQSKAGATDLTPGTARFTPARRGRGVVVQRYISGSWRSVASGTQNSRGMFSFNINASTGQTYRAVTVAKNGAPAKKSANVTATLPAPNFSDNFDTLGSPWQTRQAGARNPSGSRVCSQSDARNARVEGGNLLLRTTRIPEQDDLTTLDKNEAEDYDATLATKCPNGQYYNGHIGTAGNFDFKYGIMAARVRLQPSQGHHGGFWSQPTSSANLGAEIDALEYYGDTYVYNRTQRAPIQHTIYQLDEVKAKVVKNRDYLLASGKTWSNSFHVFSVEWTPNVYIFRIDGVETFRTTSAVSQVDQYLILSLLSSDYELAKQKPTTTPMYVDWVRVWER